MKKLTTIIAILFSVTAFGQPKANPKPVIDTVVNIPDSIQFISKKHVAEAYKRLDAQLKTLEDKLTVAQFKKLAEGIDAAFGELINVATEEYMKKKNPGK